MGGNHDINRVRLPVLHGNDDWFWQSLRLVCEYVRTKGLPAILLLTIHRLTGLQSPAYPAGLEFPSHTYASTAE